jgi:uncharacterized protein YlzI (FlbEa/FlbD family)
VIAFTRKGGKGPVYINPDQIATIYADSATTKIVLGNGGICEVDESLDDAIERVL